jgi:hypothetical protein
MNKILPKILITLATIFYGIMPVIADLSDSHLLNPSWMPHAKFHLVWLLSTNSLFALFAVVGPIFIAAGHLISDRTKN